MLDDRKQKMIDYLEEGRLKKTEIARKIGVSRQALYNWLNEPEIVAELDRRLQQKKYIANKVMESKVNDVLDMWLDLMENTSDDRVKKDLIIQWVKYSLGDKEDSKNYMLIENKPTINIDELVAKIKDKGTINE